MKKQITSWVLPIDNTRTYAAGIHEKDMDDEILSIYLHPISSYDVKPLTTGISYNSYIKRINSINTHIKNNKYKLCVCDKNGSVSTTNSQTLDEFKVIKKFELVRFTKTLEFVTVSKKVIQDCIKKENQIIAKQKEIDAIKGFLTTDNISDEGIQQLKHIIGIK